MDCNITFVCGSTAKRTYQVNYVAGNTSMPCGDHVKNLPAKEATFTIEEFAKVAAQLLISSGLCLYVTLEGNKVKWKCRTSLLSRYTFRLVRLCRYDGFINAAKKALKYQDQINPIVSIAYFFSKQDHAKLAYGKSILVESMDMINIVYSYGFMPKEKFDGICNSTYHGHHQYLYPKQNNKKFKELVEEWKNS